MTTITATIENNSYWNNTPFDQLFGTDFDFNQVDDYDKNCMWMNEEYEEISSSSSSEVNYSK